MIGQAFESRDGRVQLFLGLTFEDLDNLRNDPDGCLELGPDFLVRFSKDLVSVVVFAREDIEALGKDFQELIPDVPFEVPPPEGKTITLEPK